MGEHTLPFYNTAAMGDQELAGYYDTLFDSGDELLFDERTGLHAIWQYKTVQTFLEAESDAISNRTTLDSLTEQWRFALNPGTWTSLAHLLRVPRATANANASDNHKIVRQAIIRGEDALSLGSMPVRQRYGSVVRSTITEEIDGLTAELSQSGIADFAPRMQRISAGIIGKILGFETTQDIKAWADAQTNLLGRKLDRHEQIAGLKGLANLSRSNLELARQTKQELSMRSCPRTLMANMLTHPPEQPLDVQLAAAAGMNLIAAGYSTTYGTALNGIKRLLGNDVGRMYWQHMENHDIAEQVVNEVTRVETALIGWERYAEQPIVLNTKETIPARSRILILLGAANRDPGIFGDLRHTISIDQPKSHNQLTFGTKGSDSHYCVGAGLAKLELSELFQQMSSRLPDLQLASADPHEYDGPDYKFRTPTTLLLTR